MPKEPDYLALALAKDAEWFARTFPHAFLVGTEAWVRPSGPQRTAAVAAKEFSEPDATPTAVSSTVLPVRKITTTFETMITVGRTPNNDVAIADVLISKFHASFRIDRGRVELRDHGSRNGTWVRQQQLGKEPVEVRLWDEIRFGRLVFLFVDSAGLWDLVRRKRVR